jgi:hypothetical protein
LLDPLLLALEAPLWPRLCPDEKCALLPLLELLLELLWLLVILLELLLLDGLLPPELPPPLAMAVSSPAFDGRLPSAVEHSKETTID